MMMKRVVRVAIICSIVLGVALVGAVIVGIFNGLSDNRALTLGWNDYRYDDSSFEIGEGSLPSRDLTEIEIDWIDGAVLILPCQDAYPSLSERTEDGSELPDSARLRWQVSKDGTKLTVKYRKSSWFFGIGSQNRNKTLILRIPEAMLPQLHELEVTSVSGNIVMDQITVEELAVDTASGNLRLLNIACDSLEVDTLTGNLEFDGTVCPKSIEIESTSADLTLRLPPESAFTLELETIGGQISSDFALTEQGELYVVGNGEAHIEVQTTSGDLLLAKRS